MKIDPDDKLLKLEEAAALCAISVKTLTAAADHGEIRLVELAPKDKEKGPKTRRVLRSELHRWWRSKNDARNPEGGENGRFRIRFTRCRIRFTEISSPTTSTSCLMLIRLFQQTPRGSVIGWLVRRFPKPCANFSRTSPPKRLVESTWPPAAGRMVLCVLDAGTGVLMNW